jgi:hypothetical protein
MAGSSELTREEKIADALRAAPGKTPTIDRMAAQVLKAMAVV